MKRRHRGQFAIALGIVLASCTPAAERDEQGTITTEGAIDVFEIQSGDCFNDMDLFEPDTTQLRAVNGVPCSEPHDNEVYAVFDIALPDFPGDSEMVDAAFGACLDRFEPFVGRRYEESSLELFPIYPTRESWNEEHDREVVCAIYDLELEKLEGTVEGSGV